MAEKSTCSKPGCGGEIINGVCPKCGQKKEATVEERQPPVGSGGWGAPVNRKPPSLSSGGMFNR